MALTCENCVYYWADLDIEGHPIDGVYCHYLGPAAWAPCEQEDRDNGEWD